MKNQCLLCKNDATLEEGHIVPAFVVRWMKDSSATGYLRHGMALNRRVQDGAKEYWLCGPCEDRFQDWEKTFSEKIFMPINRGEAARFTYGPWLLKFSISVSWRVLSYLRQSDLSHFTGLLQRDADDALETWRRFLLDERPVPDPFEQHMILMDEIGSYTGDLPTNINRYLLRTIDMDAASNGVETFVYTKMCRVILVGFINIREPSYWQGSRIDGKQGQIGRQEYILPSTFGNYLLERAKKASGFYGKISAKQAEKILRSYRQNMQRAADSEIWRAMDRDVQFFGKEAFDKDKQ